MPVVSALLVFHCDTPFLRPAITSLLGQTFRDLEVVLVDNGARVSADSLGGLARDPRLRWVRLEKNLGIPGGHNAGLAAVQGEFVALLDHDDIALPHRFEKQVAALHADPGLGLVGSLAESIDKDGVVTGREFALTAPVAMARYTQFAAPVVTPAFTGRRAVFTALPYREAFPFSADFDFLARAAERWPVAAVPEVLLHYRHHAAQTTVARRAAIVASETAVRLLTARRRAGRDENFAVTVAALAQILQAPPTPALSCLLAARACLAENFFVLAAFHARRAFVHRRDAATLMAGLRVFSRILMRAKNDRVAAARMFFTGPVRALGLRPAI